MQAMDNSTSKGETIHANNSDSEAVQAKNNCDPSREKGPSRNSVKQIFGKRIWFSRGESEIGFRKETYIAVYVAVGVTVGVVICIMIVLFILMHRKGRLQIRRDSVRHLFLRGFSTVSQRGAIDSTAEFEMVNTSVSSEDANASQYNRRSSHGRNSKPKKPERRRQTSSSNAQYENVTLDPQAGFVVRKSLSMGSEIPFIDNGTLDLKSNEKDDDNDDVFH